MHLLAKALSKKTGASPKAANQFTPALNNIMGKSTPKSQPATKKRIAPNYKIPKTPKVSGVGWGG